MFLTGPEELGCLQDITCQAYHCPEVNQPQKSLSAAAGFPCPCDTALLGMAQDPLARLVRGLGMGPEGTPAPGPGALKLARDASPSRGSAPPTELGGASFEYYV